MTSPTASQQYIANNFANAFQVPKPSVTRHWDAKQENHIDVAAAKEGAGRGVTAYGTIGLSEYPLMYNGSEFHLRVELLGACRETCSDFPRALSTAAFCIINSKWFCAPGIVFPDVISVYGLSNTMSDLYFVPASMLKEGFDSREIEGRKVAWLLAIPISKAERAYAHENGPATLEVLFARAQIDFYDINRPSVV